MASVSTRVVRHTDTVKQARLRSGVEVMTGRVKSMEEAVLHRVRPFAFPVLRVLLGAVFVWFGVLKAVNVSPVADLVARTLPWFPGSVVVPSLGVVEMTLGLALVAGIMQRLVLPVLVAHLAGTFLTFLMVPALMFRNHDLLLLTGDGEFVVKNLVLISAALVLLAHAPKTTQ